MRKRPSSQNGGHYSGGPRRNTSQSGSYQQNNGGGRDRGQQHHHRGGPRKNYPALREKYINQGRAALSSGDRVLAEYWFQHAEHCYRMMEEEGYKPRQWQNRQDEGDASAPQEPPRAAAGTEQEPLSTNSNALPAFLTAGFQAPGQEQPAPAAAGEEWEDR